MPESAIGSAESLEAYLKMSMSESRTRQEIVSASLETWKLVVYVPFPVMFAAV